MEIVMKMLPTLWLMFRAARVAKMTPSEIVRMVALVTLAKLAWSEGSQTYRMHLGAARGCFRRACGVSGVAAFHRIYREA
jgi:hypothetical protein